MPKERLDISNFQAAAYPAFDPLDLPPEVASYAVNVDAATKPGVLQGVRGPATVAATTGAWTGAVALDQTVYAWDGGSWQTIDLSTFGLSAFSGTTPGGALVEGAQTVIGEAARWPVNGASPLWLGPIRKGTVFGRTASAARMTTAPLEAPSDINVIVTDKRGSKGNLIEGATYHFFAAWLYDGYQEGPLTDLGVAMLGSNATEADLEVQWVEPTAGATPIRAEALLIYVIEDLSGGATAPSDLPLRFVSRLPVDDTDLWSTPAPVTEGINANNNTAWSPNNTLTASEFSYNEQGHSSPTNEGDETFTITAADITADTILEVIVSVNTTITAEGDGQSSAEATLTTGGTTSTSTERLFTSGVETLHQTGLTLTGTDTIEIACIVDADTTSDGESTAVIELEVQVITDAGVGQQTTTTLTFNGSTGRTHLDRTGVSRETLEDQVVAYEHAVAAAPYHVIGGTTVNDKIGDAYSTASYILRSKSYRPDTFDWINDYVQIKGFLRGLAYYNRHVLAFTDDGTYVIDVQQWVVIQEIPNVSAFGPTAAVSTPEGLVFCDENGVYLWNVGEEHRPISRAIEVTESGNFQYIGEVTAATFDRILYVPSTRMVCILYTPSSTPLAWAYVMPTPLDRETRAQAYWTFLDSGSFGASAAGSHVSQEGDTFLFTTDGLLRIMDRSASRLPWVWASKEFAPRGATWRFTAYHLEPLPRIFNGAIQYREDRGAWQTASTDPLDPGTYVANTSASSPPWTKVQQFAFRLLGSSNDEVRAVGFTHRGLPAASDE